MSSLFNEWVEASNHGELWNYESYKYYLNSILKFSKSWFGVLESGLILLKSGASKEESTI